MAYSKSQIYTSHNWLSKPLSFYLGSERMRHFWVKTLLASPAPALNHSYLHCHVCRIHSFCACLLMWSWDLCPYYHQFTRLVSLFPCHLCQPCQAEKKLVRIKFQAVEQTGQPGLQWQLGKLMSMFILWDHPRNCTLCQQVPQLLLEHRRSVTAYSIFILCFLLPYFFSSA